MIDGCLTNSKSGDFDWRCWSACTSTYYTGPCSDPINADQGTPFSYRFPKDITSVFSLVFSIIMCILSLWVSSLFEGNRELSCASGTREEAREPRIVSSPLACSLACYRAPRLACHSKWRALFYVSLNSINCIVVSSLLFSPSIYKSCFVICLQLPPPRLVYRLFAGGKVM